MVWIVFYRNYSEDEGIHWLADTVWAAWMTLVDQIEDDAHNLATDDPEIIERIHDSVIVGREILNQRVDTWRLLIHSWFRGLQSELQNISQMEASVYEMPIAPEVWTEELAWIPHFISLLRRKCRLDREINPWDGASTAPLLTYYIPVKCWKKPVSIFVDWILYIAMELGLSIQSPVNLSPDSRIIIEGPGAQLYLHIVEWWDPKEDATKLEQLKEPFISPI